MAYTWESIGDVRGGGPAHETFWPGKVGWASGLSGRKGNGGF